MVRGKNRKPDTQRAASVSSEGSQGDKLGMILEKLTNMESLLAATQAENKKLQETVTAQNVKINDLQTRLNNLEQHGRSFSVRVNNLSLEGVDERDPPAMINKVFNTVFLPILQGAASLRAISQVPSCYETIEMAHPLPGRSDRPKPIIVRFFNRNIKAVLFRHRKEFAIKSEEKGPVPRYKYPFHDDLTRDNFNKMKQLQGDPRVHSCWSTGGSLRYRLTGSDVIKRVPSVYMSNDEILK
jgi:hypothetical protein